MKKRTLSGLHRKVFDKPLLITTQALNPIVDYMLNPERSNLVKEVDDAVGKPMASSFDDDNASYQRALAEYYGLNLETGVGTINVDGVLVNRAGQIQGCVELTSYEAIKEQFDTLCGLGMSTCVMQFDSGGGEAYRCFGTAQAIRKSADKNGVKIIAYVDGFSASASYALTCIADEIISNPQSQVGSIGVVVQLYNDSKYLENLGVERSFVYAGDSKIPYDKDGKFADGFIERLQQSVDKTYGTFVQHVASNRNLSVEQVIGTQANVYDVDEALEIGLIDKVLEIEEFEDYLNSMTGKQQTGLSMSEQNELTKVQATLTETEAKLTAKDSEIATLKASLENAGKALADLQKAKEEADTKLANYQAEAKLAGRKAQLAEVFGSESEKVDQFATMFASLGEEQFTSMVAEFGVKREQKAEEMKEQGHANKEQPLANTAQEQANALAELARKRKQA